ncbi:hypothetical protein PPL_09732 [Heterostelium album PN500]|uniref:Uncharacterized protein n=1 Tax=Heterostelium pallidum (strain ATCC 26659 / Pp 5 / PN500) TaxID=670386 RepID=D3BNM9_HETP5|nr:hypothetical protein PPL_09732 [Heterostelium album PN500]EFA76980.1 hypothetical protein PPL_09732 [Heterostelium album PN500]|eukprot:XP_020429111.1 hypothetical protein PPL_09732 [Heterostelium album PN500]
MKVKENQNMEEQLIDKSYFTSLYKQIRLQEFLEVAHTILLDRLENGYGKTVKGVPLGCLPVELFRDHFSSFRSWRSYTKDRVTLINGEKVSVQHLYFTFNARSGFPTLSSGKEWVKKKIEKKDGTEPVTHEYQKVTFIISYRDTRVECDFKMSVNLPGGNSQDVNPQQQIQQPPQQQQQQQQLPQQQQHQQVQQPQTHHQPQQQQQHHQVQQQQQQPPQQQYQQMPQQQQQPQQQIPQLPVLQSPQPLQYQIPQPSIQHSSSPTQISQLTLPPVQQQSPVQQSVQLQKPQIKLDAPLTHSPPQVHTPPQQSQQIPPPQQQLSQDTTPPLHPQPVIFLWPTIIAFAYMSLILIEKKKSQSTNKIKKVHLAVKTKQIQFICNQNK